MGLHGSFLRVLIGLALAAPLPAQGGEAVGQADERQTVAAVADLERGLASRKPVERAAAIERAPALADRRFVAVLRRALGDESPEVRLAAIAALGRVAHPDSLAALHTHYKEHKKTLRKDERLLPPLLGAIARHGSVESIPILLDDVRAQPTRAALEARILGLGQIRSPQAIDAVFELVSRVGFVEMHLYSDDVRLALAILTGEDKGRSFDAWRAWWNAAKAEFTVAPAPPAIDRALWERWCKFWGLDPERGGAR